VDALANISCGEMFPNDCSNETNDTAEASTFEEEEGAENERRENAFVGTLSLSREGVKHCLNCECAMAARQMCLYNKSLKIYMHL